MQTALEVRRENMLSSHVRNQFTSLATLKLTKAADISKKIKKKLIEEKEAPNAFLELKSTYSEAGLLFEAAARYERAAFAFSSESSYSYLLGDLKSAIENKVRASDCYVKAAQIECPSESDKNSKIKGIYYKLSISLLKDTIEIWQNTLETVRQKEVEIATFDLEIKNTYRFGYPQEIPQIKDNMQKELEMVKEKLGISSIEAVHESIKKLMQKVAEIQFLLRELDEPFKAA